MPFPGTTSLLNQLSVALEGDRILFTYVVLVSQGFTSFFFFPLLLLFSQMKYWACSSTSYDFRTIYLLLNCGCPYFLSEFLVHFTLFCVELVFSYWTKSLTLGPM